MTCYPKKQWHQIWPSKLFWSHLTQLTRPYGLTHKHRLERGEQKNLRKTWNLCTHQGARTYDLDLYKLRTSTTIHKCVVTDNHETKSLLWYTNLWKQDWIVFCWTIYYMWELGDFQWFCPYEEEQTAISMFGMDSNSFLQIASER